MEAFATTHPGIEAVAANEIEELIQAKTKTEPGVVLFDSTGLPDLCKLAYLSRSLIKVGILISAFSFSTEQDILRNIKVSTFSHFLSPSASFVVRCSREGEHDFSSQDISESVGEVLIKTKAKVSFSNPDIVVYLYITGQKCYVGIDLTGEDLGKRQYRIFTHMDSVRAPIAHAMLRLAGYDSKKVLLDPFCGGGTICIEAALQAAGRSAHYFTKEQLLFTRLPLVKDTMPSKLLEGLDKQADLRVKPDITGYDHLLRFVKASQKNAKIAGMDKLITFSKVEVEWLDTKVKEKSVDCLVTYPPPRTNANAKMVEKMYGEFFHQAEYVLKKEGRMVLLTATPDVFLPLAHKYNFLVKSQQLVMQGKKEMVMMVLQRH